MKSSGKWSHIRPVTSRSICGVICEHCAGSRGFHTFWCNQLTLSHLIAFIVDIIIHLMPLQNDSIQKMIDSGDMEQLAMVVLNGDGKSLIGKETTQPDIQAFIDNVPTYMVSGRPSWLTRRINFLELFRRRFEKSTWRLVREVCVICKRRWIDESSQRPRTRFRREVRRRKKFLFWINRHKSFISCCRHDTTSRRGYFRPHR